MASPAASHHVFRFGGFELDLDAQELRKHGLLIKLNRQPFQILARLLESNGVVVSRKELQDLLWSGEQFGDHDQRLNRAVNKLREALNDTASAPRYLGTVPRVGYRILVRVESLDAPAAGAPEPRLAVVERTTEPALVRRPGHKIAWLGAGVATVAALTGAVWFLEAQRKKPASLLQTPITTYVGSERFASFSPDGTRVVFYWDRGTPQSGLYVVALAEGGVTPLPGGIGMTRPAWSPDGKSIAAIRMTGIGPEVWVLSPDGASPRRVRQLNAAAGNGTPAWTPDSNSVVVTDVADGQFSLYRISVRTASVTRLTSSPALRRGQLSGDYHPAVSPDGRFLAFTRDTAGVYREIFVVALGADFTPTGEPRRLTDLRQSIDSLAWTADSAQLLFSAGAPIAGLRYLHRVALSGGAPVHVGGIQLEGMEPAVSRDGRMVAYTRRNLSETSTQRVDVAGNGRPVELLKSTSPDYSADVSPDSQKLVISSIRSGTSQLWIDDLATGQLRQLTNLRDGAAVPRWSPDGRRIAFDSRADGQSEIFVIDGATAKMRRLTYDPALDSRPNWSRDGRWIYFQSTRTGTSQVWKVPSEGGPAVQVTRGGGEFAVESFDGKVLYYTTRNPYTVRQVPVAGGEEKEIATGVMGYSAIAVGRDEVYYFGAVSGDSTTLYGYEIATGRTRTIATVDHPVHGVLSLFPDGKSLVYTEFDREDTDLMLIRNFR